jgi:hypothetical protein
VAIRQILYLKVRAGQLCTGNQIRGWDLSWQSFKRREVELAERIAMTTSRIDSNIDQIDHKTCRYICDAVGERLQQSMRPESSLSAHLQQLVDELRRRESDRRSI